MGRRRREGGRVGQNLVAMGAVDAAMLDAFIDAVPPEPLSARDTGIDENSLVDLILKTMATRPVETLADLAAWLKLPPKVVSDLVDFAVRGQLMALAGSSGDAMAMHYEMTEHGKRRAQEALERSQYVGPAPIPLDVYTHWLQRQKINNEAADVPTMQKAFDGL